jgi:energy-coupling factor transporter ATP-binding protein EcfA2
MHVATLEVSGVRGFHGARSVELDFRRPDGSFAGWTVLAGRNSSGKSTLLQAIALVLSGPRATSFIPSLADWITSGALSAELSATLHVSDEDTLEPSLFPPRVWMRFQRPEAPEDEEIYSAEPDFSGSGLDSFSSPNRLSSAKSASSGWFYVGYGPFRHLGDSGAVRSRKTSRPKLSLQVGSLFDETASLVDAVDWLVDQRLQEYENRSGAAELIRIMIALLGDGLLPDGFKVSDVNSDGLWISFNNSNFPLREMSDGYRAVTALVVDIVRQMSQSYRNLRMDYKDDTPVLAYPGVVLIDEIDAHLHVSWQKVIGTWLKEHFPQVQFIVTTHSPYVCQSADPGGLIRLPGPSERRPPQIVDDDLYRRIIYGSGDDAVLTELFGVDTPYSAEAEEMRERLGDLEVKVLKGLASDEEKLEYKALSQRLTSSLGTRAEEVIRRLEREQ